MKQQTQDQAQIQQGHKLLTPGLLLDEHGNLSQAGFAYSEVKEYRRSMVKASTWRIKEWDYYYVGDPHYGIALTIADLAYGGLVSATLLDFKNKREWSKSCMKWMTFGSLALPQSSQQGDVNVNGKDFSFKFTNDKGKRHLKIVVSRFRGQETLCCDIRLQTTVPSSMVIATPFDKPGHFYYNRKINLLKGTGSFSLGGLAYEYGGNTYGVLDWGRGVWTYDNTWYWASMSGEYDGHLYGFNLGYGFGITSKASQNMFFYDKEVYKLDDVQFNIPKSAGNQDSYLEPWTLTSTSKKAVIDLAFLPILDRASNFNYLVIKSNQHQVFGLFSGTITVGGKHFQFKDMIGFAEKVRNCW